MSSGPSPDDFIIADEDVPITSTNTYTSTSAPVNPANPTKSPWVPQVDLSQAFTPFASELQFSAVRELQYTGGDTLDEPVWHTLRRDAVQIGHRVVAVVWPPQLQKLKAQIQGAQASTSVSSSADDSSSAVLLDWDLWGPLIFSLAYLVAMGVAAPAAQTNAVFSGTFSFMWLFFLVVGLNIQLLGGYISFLLAISATGYLMFPVVIGAIVNTLFVRWRLVRVPVMAVLWIWSVYAATVSLRSLGVLPGRVFLAMYPVALMYAVLSWLVVIT